MTTTIDIEVYYDSDTVVSMNTDQRTVELQGIPLTSVIDALSFHCNKLKPQDWYQVLDEIPTDLIQRYLSDE